MKRDIDKLLFGVGRQRLWVIAGSWKPFSASVLAHLLKRLAQLGLGKAGSRLELAGTLQAGYSIVAPLAPSTLTVPIKVRGAPRKTRSTPSCLRAASTWMVS